MEPFRYYLRVRYIECDAQKVVFNSRYGEYVDVSINEFLRAIGGLPALPDGRPRLHQRVPARGRRAAGVPRRPARFPARETDGRMEGAGALRSSAGARDR